MRAAGLLIVLITGCASARAPRPEPQDPPPPANGNGGPQASPDEEALRQRVKQLEAELAKAQADLARLRSELFTMQLKAATPENAPTLLRDALRSPFPELRVAAIRAIAALAPDKQMQFIDTVVASLASGNAASRAEAVTLLARIDHNDARVAVLAAVRDPEPDVRRAAATALRTNDGVDALVGLLSDPVRQVRLAAVESLGAARSARAVAPLIRLLKEEKEPDVLEKAIDALGIIGSKDAIDTIVAILKSATTDGLKFSTINALGKIGEPRTAEEIRPYLASGTPDNIREIAIDAVGKLKDLMSVEPLLKLLADEGDRPRLREQAARALGLIGDKSAFDGLLDAVGKFENGRSKAAWSAALVLSGASVPHLVRLASYALKAGRRAEVEEVCSKLHQQKADDQVLQLEEQIAAATVAAREWRAALGHLARLPSERGDVLLIRSLCHRELGEFDTALRLAADAGARSKSGEAPWWAAQLDRLSTLDAAKRHADLVRESWDLMQLKDAPSEAGAAHLKGSNAILDALCGADLDARSRAASSIKELGPKILTRLADALESPDRKDGRAVIIEAGNAAAGTTFTVNDDTKTIVAGWRKK